ncbi:hypothetical protein [Roseimarinus sediminis]|uniref:hypothetical protein n=1 Tax=Roseimarinus sediminis TaxID=1610899 RepID=UPI003D1D097B
MKQITDLLLHTEHDIILTLIRRYDPQARIVLQGPGVRTPGRELEIYLTSRRMNEAAAREIKQQLCERFFINVEVVRVMNERSKFMRMPADVELM